MMYKFCSECGNQFAARSQANKSCSRICGTAAAQKLKARKHAEKLQSLGLTRSKGTIVNDERQKFERTVPGIALARQLWNKNFKIEITE